MTNARTLRPRLLAAVLVAALASFAPLPARGASKEIIELQTQVQQLLDMVQRMQSTLDSRFGALQGLMQQTVDNSTRVSAAMDALQQKLAAQNEAISGKVDSTSGQVQSVSDSVEELKSRIDKLNSALQALQSQLQNAQPAPQSQPAPGSGSPSGPGGSPNAGVPAGQGSGAAPPLEDTFQAGLRDFNGARYSVAQGEFQDVLQYYPQDDLAGAAQFYLGEISYRQQDYSDAVKAYNAVLENYPNSNKAAAAQLHKGLALLDMNRRSAGVQELRSLIQRHPQSPEAQQARSKLNGLGVRITASR